MLNNQLGTKEISGDKKAVKNLGGGLKMFYLVLMWLSELCTVASIVTEDVPGRCSKAQAALLPVSVTRFTTFLRKTKNHRLRRTSGPPKMSKLSLPS